MPDFLLCLCSQDSFWLHTGGGRLGYMTRYRKVVQDLFATGLLFNTMEKKTKKKGGVYIPDEFIEDERLTWPEKALLSLYYHYTTNGEKHCCYLTNEDVMGRLHLSRPTFFRFKHHLKQLGLIDTDGGIKTWYVNRPESQNETVESQNDNPKK